MVFKALAESRRTSAATPQTGHLQPHFEPEAETLMWMGEVLEESVA